MSLIACVAFLKSRLGTLHASREHLVRLAIPGRSQCAINLAVCYSPASTIYVQTCGVQIEGWRQSHWTGHWCDCHAAPQCDVLIQRSMRKASPVKRILPNTRQCRGMCCVSCAAADGDEGGVPHVVGDASIGSFGYSKCLVNVPTDSSQLCLHRHVCCQRSKVWQEGYTS